MEEELARYDAVIHLRTPAQEEGYNQQNPLRTESATAAAEIDSRVLRAWEMHPRRFVVGSSASFLDKAARAIDILRAEMPECCRRHVVPAFEQLREPGDQHCGDFRPAGNNPQPADTVTAPGAKT